MSFQEWTQTKGILLHPEFARGQREEMFRALFDAMRHNLFKDLEGGAVGDRAKRIKVTVEAVYE